MRHILDAVCTVLNSWWWTEKPYETCTVTLNKLQNCTSSWFYYRNQVPHLAKPLLKHIKETFVSLMKSFSFQCDSEIWRLTMVFFFNFSLQFRNYYVSLCTGWSKRLCAPDDYSTKNTQKYSILNSFITGYIRNVDRAILNTVVENTIRLVNKCLETGGGHFEHYL